MYRKKENKIDLKLLRRTSKACSCLFSSSYVTDASDRILRIYFQLKSYPAVFSSDRILFIHVLITANSRHKTTVLDKLK